jgi:hypothetical protein
MAFEVQDKPALPPQCDAAGLFESVELLQGIVESGVFLVDYVRVGHFEEVVGWDPVEPLLLGDLFVIGEIETDEEFYRAGVGGLFVGFFMLFGLCRF